MDTGFIPRLDVSGNRILVTAISLTRNDFTLSIPSSPCIHSIPAYISSVFSLNITISTKPGSFTGEGTPSNQRTGLTHEYKSSFCLKATLSDRIPPPTGVVKGPFKATKCLEIVSNVSWGSHSSFKSNAFSPAKISNQ